MKMWENFLLAQGSECIAKMKYCILYSQVSLKLDEKELEFALQDKVMISSILKDGLPSKKK